jgi:hypothetical protein
MLKPYHTTNKAQIFTALILTGIFSVGSGLTLIKSATANPANLSSVTTKEVSTAKAKPIGLPPTVANAVLQDLTSKTGIPTRELQIIEYSQKTWGSGCLGLSIPDIVCTTSLVPGWRVVVSNGKQKWVYHTDETGRTVRLASTSSVVNKRLPKKVKDAVLAQAQKISKLPAQSLKIIDYKATNWADGCDRPTFPHPCDPILISGWQVTVGAGNQQWVFLSDNDGSRIELVDSHNSSTTVKPVPIPASELPLPLDQGIVFRYISSGGFAGLTYQTVLLDDGTVIRVRIGDANDSERSVRRVSAQQVREFEQLLRRSRGVFRNVSYPAPQGSADFITYTLTSRDGTVQYNDISQNGLPTNLRRVINAWNQLLANSQ